MASYTCEEPSVCTKFQSSICSHCNRRLCRTHIDEHNKFISSILSLSNDINRTHQDIKNESQKRKNTFNDIFVSFNKWRQQQIEKIDEIHQNHFKFIQSQREVLNNAEAKLFEQLKQNARQPLEHLKGQKNVNMEIINHIRQTIQNVRVDNCRLKCQLITLPPTVDVELSSLNIPSISLSPKSNNNNSKKKKKKSMTNVVHSNRGRPLKRLVKMFANISFIEASKNNITIYLKNLGRQFQLPVVICSYLTAWYKKSKIDEKALLLNEHITTIQKYLTNCKSGFDVLIGIQAFFHNQIVKENKVEMMTFLLQFFLNHQCIDQNQIITWYTNQDALGVLAYKGFDHAKKLATPFIKSLSTKQSVADQSIKMEIKEETKQTVVNQSVKMEIKEETKQTVINQSVKMEIKEEVIVID